MLRLILHTDSFNHSTILEKYKDIIVQTWLSVADTWNLMEDDKNVGWMTSGSWDMWKGTIIFFYLIAGLMNCLLGDNEGDQSKVRVFFFLFLFSFSFSFFFSSSQLCSTFGLFLMNQSMDKSLNLIIA